MRIVDIIPTTVTVPDAHYHHLTDNILVGGKIEHRDDRDKLARDAELYRELGGYPYDRDPQRPGWFSVQPEQRFARLKRR